VSSPPPRCTAAAHREGPLLATPATTTQGILLYMYAGSATSVLHMDAVHGFCLALRFCASLPLPCPPTGLVVLFMPVVASSFIAFSYTRAQRPKAHPSRAWSQQQRVNSSTIGDPRTIVPQHHGHLIASPAHISRRVSHLVDYSSTATHQQKGRSASPQLCRRSRLQQHSNPPAEGQVS
jgi:hypothetical protein